jgi:NAD(P)-dependent dehydrogenase (short-subunit alcohol dehydrogenase family)
VLRAQRDGHFIQISSIGGRRASMGLSAYQAAKFAVEGFSESLANEVGPLGIRVTIVEPGGFRTDWSGSSMRIGEIREDYEATVGSYVKFTREHRGAAHGDPAKAAQAILRIASEKEPPLRLLLGSDAVFLASVAAAKRAEEDAMWKALSLSTDFDGLQDFSETPFAKMLAAKRS